jgi:lipoprotein-anchoring transpeptidase ErfK/SrfK
MLPLPVVPGKRIVISITEQHMWTYEAGALRSEHVISTGIARSPTLPGLFQVQSHYENAYASRWDLWMPHFLGIYDALPGFTNGIHGLPLLSSGVRLWGNVLGRPASYGCIILDLEAAEELYAWAEDGVVVEIRS